MRSLDIILGIIAAFLAAHYLYKRAQSSVNLPPGPPSLPLLGNLLDLTQKELWLRAQKWGETYGDVTHLSVLGQSLIFLNSREAAEELLDRRGYYYSSKPRLIMVGELCGCQDMLPFTAYNTDFKERRTLFRRGLGPQSIQSYHPLIHTRTRLFLRDILSKPSDYMNHIRRYAGGLTLSIVYGYEALPQNDPFLSLAEECVDIFANKLVMNGGIWPVDVFPFLQYVPSWMPGGAFKQKAATWKRKMDEFVDRPYEYVKKALCEGVAEPSFCSRLIEDNDTRSGFEHDLKWTANSMYAGSADTTITTMGHFFLAICLNPNVLKKAHHELDSVVGHHRLPDFQDRAKLPYIEAIYLECLRWGVPAPIGLPHSTTLRQDDEYRGLRIPKNAMVFANIWSMLRDKEIFRDPDSFVPERYLEEVDEETRKLRDPRNVVFGFGRRICPGMHLVDSSIWLLMACSLATLDIAKYIDADGNVIEPVTDFNNAVFRTPDQFVCDIRPRSEEASRNVLD